jgi:hypothetical protein
MAVPWLRRLIADFLPRRPGFDPRSGHVGFVVDRVIVGQVFSEYFGFPCQFSFHQLLLTHLSSGAHTIDHLVADVPSGLSFTPPHEINKEIKYYCVHKIIKWPDFLYHGLDWGSCLTGLLRLSWRRRYDLQSERSDHRRATHASSTVCSWCYNQSQAWDYLIVKLF